MKTLLLALLILWAPPLAGQSLSPADSLARELSRARAFNQASQTQLVKTTTLLERFRREMLPEGSGVWTMRLPLDEPWHARATLPADSGLATIVLDSAGVVRDSASVWMGRRR